MRNFPFFIPHRNAFFLFLFIVLLHGRVYPLVQGNDEELDKDNQRISDYSERMVQFYDMKPRESWKDITEEVLSSPDTSLESKQSIRTYQRRIIVFKYPSDGLLIKGFISFTQNPDHHPLLILYRWGNENFALMNPGVIFATYKNYTTVSSTLRGGVSEGKDEYGGADVDDMKNLIEYLPTLAHQLGISLHPSCLFMLGPSRGGLEMFLTLARFPQLQNRVDKVVALSAALDLHQFIDGRSHDIEPMLHNRFGLPRGAKSSDWIAKRNPLNTIPFLKKSLPILIIQGTADNRVGLEEGHHMTDLLQQHGNSVNYWEVPKGNHVLTNTPHIMGEIAHWLESNSPCLSIRIKTDAHLKDSSSPFTGDRLPVMNQAR